MMRRYSEKGRYTMRTGSLSRLVGLVAVAMVLSSVPATSQEATNMFVVYGSVYADTTGAPAGARFIVTVEILTAEEQVRTHEITVLTRTGVDHGKYCAVFFAVGPDPVAMVTDMIRIRARREGETLDNYYKEEFVELDDIIAKRKRIDFIEDQISVEFNSWGAIKSLFGAW